MRASEGGHWYDRDGTPRYEVVGANGKTRPATLRDARKFGWYPGVTSIIKCAAAPGLENWKQNQVLMAALTLPRVEGESAEVLCARIMADSGEQARKARDRGTEIHAAIQGHYEGKAPPEEMWPFVRGISEAIRANIGERQWIAEKPCAHPAGYGTKSDLHCAGGSAFLDFKGSDFTKETMAELKTWDEHAMQLAATRRALGFECGDCAICYVSRSVPGLCRLIWIDEDVLTKGLRMFDALLAYWQAKTNYYPALWTPAEKVAA